MRPSEEKLDDTLRAVGPERAYLNVLASACAMSRKALPDRTRSGTSSWWCRMECNNRNESRETRWYT